MLAQINSSSGTTKISDIPHSYIGYDNTLITPNMSIGTGNTNPSCKLTVNKYNYMRQVKAALFNVERDEKTNEIINANFAQEFWFTQKPGISFEVSAMKALGFVINPDTEVLREIYTVSF